MFLVRYSEQSVPLASHCIFRTEIDVEEGYLETEFKLEVELMFTDLKQMK